MYSYLHCSVQMIPLLLDMKGVYIFFPFILLFGKVILFAVYIQMVASCLKFYLFPPQYFIPLFTCPVGFKEDYNPH